MEEINGEKKCCKSHSDSREGCKYTLWNICFIYINILFILTKMALKFIISL